MQITFLHNAADFEALAAEWNDLLARAATDVPFLKHEYLKVWWSTLGGGEWESGKLWIAVGRDQGGEVVGIAPFFETQSLDGLRGLMFLGAVEISDYLDLIVTKEAVRPFVEALFTALEEVGSAKWGMLDLYNIPEASPSLSAFEVASKKRGWKVVTEKLQPCPVISLKGSWEDYLARLDKKQRHELRRKMRRADRHPSGVLWRVVRPEEDIKKPTDIFLDLIAKDKRKTSFLTEEMRAQFHLSVQAAHNNGWLHLSFLEVGGAPAAGYLNFDYGGKLWVYNSGIHSSFLALSPGWVLLGNLIQWAIENNRREVDFLRGGERYKYQFGGVDTSIFRVKINP